MEIALHSDPRTGYQGLCGRRELVSPLEDFLAPNVTGSSLRACTTASTSAAEASGAQVGVAIFTALVDINVGCQDLFVLVDLTLSLDCQLSQSFVPASVNVGCAGVVDAAVKCKDPSSALSHRYRVGHEDGECGQHLGSCVLVRTWIDIVLSRGSQSLRDRSSAG